MGVWGSYYNIPKAIICVLKGDDRFGLAQAQSPKPRLCFRALEFGGAVGIWALDSFSFIFIVAWS